MRRRRTAALLIAFAALLWVATSAAPEWTDSIYALPGSVALVGLFIVVNPPTLRDVAWTIRKRFAFVVMAALLAIAGIYGAELAGASGAPHRVLTIPMAVAPSLCLLAVAGWSVRPMTMGLTGVDIEDLQSAGRVTAVALWIVPWVVFCAASFVVALKHGSLP